jgi:hypothetical protein
LLIVFVVVVAVVAVVVVLVIDDEMLVLHVIAAFGLSLVVLAYRYILPVLKYLQDKMSYFRIAFADACLTTRSCNIERC